MPSSDFTDKLLQEIEDLENGFFQIENQNGDAYLSVSPPGKSGKPVQFNQIITRLQLFGVEDFKEEEIKKIVKEADGKFHKIGKWSGGQPEDSFAEISVTEDKMQANVILHPPRHGGKVFTKERLYEELRKVGIQFGFIDEIIEELASNPQYFKPYTVAEGKQPEPGLDGGIEYLFDIKNRPQLVEDNYGRVDFKEIGIIKSVEKGTIIARKIDPKPGKDGKNIYGEVIPFPPGRESQWKIGANVSLSPNGKEAIADITGRPVLERNGTLRVDQVIHLESVDYSTGNVDFPGTIIVEEKIADGFRLNAKGSLIIKKSVGKVFLEADGDIILSGGFMGRGSGTIKAKGEIYAKFVEQGKMISGKSVFIEEASLHSEITAEEDIVVQGGRGEIIGGELIAGKSITCNKLGAVVETKTTLTVGTPPEFISEMEKIRQEIQSKKEILQKVDQTMNHLLEEAAKRELNEEEQTMLKKLREVEKRYRNMLQNAQSQLENAINTFEPNKDSFVLVEREIYPGVTINMGKGKYYKVQINSIIGRSKIYMGQDGNIHNDRTNPRLRK